MFVHEQILQLYPNERNQKIVKERPATDAHLVFTIAHTRYTSVKVPIRWQLTTKAIFGSHGLKFSGKVKG